MERWLTATEMFADNEHLWLRMVEGVEDANSPILPYRCPSSAGRVPIGPRLATAPKRGHKFVRRTTQSPERTP